MHLYQQWLKSHTQSWLLGMMGSFRTFSTPYINNVILQRQRSLAVRGRGITVLFCCSAGRCLIEAESQEQVLWNGEGFPTVCVTAMSSEPRSSLQILFHAFTAFHPAVCFPQPFFPASPCILFMTQCTNKLSRRGPQGGHLMHGVASISYHSQYSQSSFPATAWGYRAKLADRD